MTAAGRADDDGPHDAAALAQRLGFAQGSAAEAEHALAAVRARHADLRRQIDAVADENRQLERELLQRLGEWRKLDDGQQLVDDVLPQVRAVMRTLPYRFAVAVRGGVRRVVGLFVRRA
ncbi:MAG: hypothetical protein ACK595_17010 [Planctomycetota bacterium]